MYNPTTKLWEGYIYIINNTENDLNYIGQTTYSISDRWLGHLSASRTGKDKTIFHRAIREIGEERFYYTKLETIACKTSVDLKLQLDRKERFYINKYNSLYPSGYNMIDGGIHFNNELKPCCLYDFDGNKIAEFNSIADASQKTKVCRTDISNCCSGKYYRTSMGVFRFSGDKFEKYPLIGNKDINGLIPVDMFDLEGTLIASFDSIRDASKALNYNYKRLVKEIKNNYIVNCKYVFVIGGNNFDLNKVKFSTRHCHIAEFDGHGNLLNVYRNIQEASKNTGVSVSVISACCSNKYRYSAKDKFMLYEQFIVNNLLKK